MNAMNATQRENQFFFGKGVWILVFATPPPKFEIGILAMLPVLQQLGVAYAFTKLILQLVRKQRNNVIMLTVFVD